MTLIESTVLGTVNAPYSAGLSACQLAMCISDIDAMKSAIGPSFSFFTEVKPDLQRAFAEQMGVSGSAVKAVAQFLQSQCANPIALAV
jgi:hypothetical protein